MSSRSTTPELATSARTEHASPNKPLGSAQDSGQHQAGVGLRQPRSNPAQSRVQKPSANAAQLEARYEVAIDDNEEGLERVKNPATSGAVDAMGNPIEVGTDVEVAPEQETAPAQEPEKVETAENAETTQTEKTKFSIQIEPG